MARSSEPPVSVSVPCATCIDTAAARTPRPSCTPAGSTVPSAELIVPGRSHLLVVQVGELGPARVVGGGAHVGEVVRDHLDPHVLRRHAGRRDVQCTHDTLLNPRAQACWPRVRTTSRMRSSSWSMQLLAVLVGALHLDHPRHLGHRVDVRLLEEALHHPAVLDRDRRRRRRGRARPPRGRAWSGPRPSTSPIRATGAPSTDMVPSAETPMLLASKGMTISPPPSSSSGWPSRLTTSPSALRVKAPARVSRSPCGRHHGEVAVALDGEVERAAGLLQRALQLVGVARPRLGHRHAAALDGQRLDLLGEDDALAAVAGGGEVGDVVGDGLELLGEARLARQRHVAGKVHAPTPAYCDTRADGRARGEPAPLW